MADNGYGDILKQIQTEAPEIYADMVAAADRAGKSLSDMCAESGFLNGFVERFHAESAVRNAAEVEANAGQTEEASAAPAADNKTPASESEEAMMTDPYHWEDFYAPAPEEELRRFNEAYELLQSEEGVKYQESAEWKKTDIRVADTDNKDMQAALDMSACRRLASGNEPITLDNLREAHEAERIRIETEYYNSVYAMWTGNDYNKIKADKHISRIADIQEAVSQGKSEADIFKMLDIRPKKEEPAAKLENIKSLARQTTAHTNMQPIADFMEKRGSIKAALRENLHSLGKVMDRIQKFEQNNPLLGLAANYMLAGNPLYMGYRSVLSARAIYNDVQGFKDYAAFREIYKDQAAEFGFNRWQEQNKDSKLNRHDYDQVQAYGDYASYLDKHRSNHVSEEEFNKLKDFQKKNSFNREDFETARMFAGKSYDEYKKYVASKSEANKKKDRPEMAPVSEEMFNNVVQHTDVRRTLNFKEYQKKAGARAVSEEEYNRIRAMNRAVGKVSIKDVFRDKTTRNALIAHSAIFWRSLPVVGKAYALGKTAQKVMQKDYWEGLKAKAVGTKKAAQTLWATKGLDKKAWTDFYKQGSSVLAEVAGAGLMLGAVNNDLNSIADGSYFDNLGITSHEQAGQKIEAPTQEPIAQKLETATREPVTQEPVTQEPVTQEPVTQEPITQEPVTQEAPEATAEIAPDTSAYSVGDDGSIIVHPDQLTDSQTLTPEEIQQGVYQGLVDRLAAGEELSPGEREFFDNYNKTMEEFTGELEANAQDFMAEREAAAQDFMAEREAAAQDFMAEREAAAQDFMAEREAAAKDFMAEREAAAKDFMAEREAAAKDFMAEREEVLNNMQRDAEEFAETRRQDAEEFAADQTSTARAFADDRTSSLNDMQTGTEQTQEQTADGRTEANDQEASSQDSEAEKFERHELEGGGYEEVGKGTINGKPAELVYTYDENGNMTAREFTVNQGEGNSTVIRSEMTDEGLRHTVTEINGDQRSTSEVDDFQSAVEEAAKREIVDQDLSNTDGIEPVSINENGFNGRYVITASSEGEGYQLAVLDGRVQMDTNILNAIQSANLEEDGDSFGQVMKANELTQEEAIYKHLQKEAENRDLTDPEKRFMEAHDQNMEKYGLTRDTESQTQANLSGQEQTGTEQTQEHPEPQAQEEVHDSRYYFSQAMQEAIDGGELISKNDLEVNGPTTWNHETGEWETADGRFSGRTGEDLERNMEWEAHKINELHVNIKSLNMQEADGHPLSEEEIKLRDDLIQQLNDKGFEYDEEGNLTRKDDYETSYKEQQNVGNEGVTGTEMDADDMTTIKGGGTKLSYKIDENGEIEYGNNPKVKIDTDILKAVRGAEGNEGLSSKESMDIARTISQAEAVYASLAGADRELTDGEKAFMENHNQDMEKLGLTRGENGDLVSENENDVPSRRELNAKHREERRELEKTQNEEMNARDQAEADKKAEDKALQDEVKEAEQQQKRDDRETEKAAKAAARLQRQEERETEQLQRQEDQARIKALRNGRQLETAEYRNDVKQINADKEIALDAVEGDKVAETAVKEDSKVQIAEAKAQHKVNQQMYNEAIKSARGR